MEGRHDAQGGGLPGKKVSLCLNLPQARAYKSFKIGELFEIHPTTAYKLTNSELFAKSGEIPVISNSSENNGITAYVGLPATEQGNKITFSDTTTSDAIFYQPNAFVGYPHVQGLYPKCEDMWNEKSYLYFLSLFKAAASGRFDYAAKFTRKIASEIKVLLPIRDDGKIDFGYMEAYIRELEIARVSELEIARNRAMKAYLAAAGFDACELTGEEQNAVDAIANGKVKTNKFKIADLFSVETPKRRFNANAVKFGGTHPYVVRTSLNNGQRGTIIADEKWLNSGDTISFGQDTATIFYQPEAYFTGDKIKVMKWQSGTLGESVACYCLATMRRAFSTFAWGQSSFNENVLKDVVVSLPVTLSGEVDHAFMETFIRGMMKRAISGVVAWKDQELAATKQVIGIGAAKKGGK